MKLLLLCLPVALSITESIKAKGVFSIEIQQDRLRTRLHKTLLNRKINGCSKGISIVVNVREIELRFTEKCATRIRYIHFIQRLVSIFTDKQANF